MPNEDLALEMLLDGDFDHEEIEDVLFPQGSESDEWYAKNLKAVPEEIEF
jgi:hypothetical protein